MKPMATPVPSYHDLMVIQSVRRGVMIEKKLPPRPPTVWDALIGLLLLGIVLLVLFFTARGIAMQTRFWVIQPDMPVLPEPTEIDLPHEPSYAQIKKIIDEPLNQCFSEHVKVLFDVPEGQRLYCSMFVDETGVLKALPVNPVATNLYQANMLINQPGTDPRDLPRIHGTAVVFERNVWF